MDLSQITLDINAVPGAGNLLGNPTNAIADLLDRVFSLLGQDRQATRNS